MALKPQDLHNIFSQDIIHVKELVVSINTHIKKYYEGKTQATASINQDISNIEKLALENMYKSAGWDQVKVEWSRDGYYISMSSETDDKELQFKELNYQEPFGPDALFILTNHQVSQVNALEHNIDKYLLANYRGQHSASFPMRQNVSANQLELLIDKYEDAGWNEVTYHSDQREGAYLCFR